MSGDRRSVKRHPRAFVTAGAAPSWRLPKGDVPFLEMVPSDRGVRRRPSAKHDSRPSTLMEWDGLDECWLGNATWSRESIAHRRNDGSSRRGEQHSSNQRGQSVAPLGHSARRFSAASPCFSMWQDGLDDTHFRWIAALKEPRRFWVRDEPGVMKTHIVSPSIGRLNNRVHKNGA